MSTFTTKDGTDLFFQDWGSGRPVVFSHGWPLNADAWDPQLNLVAAAGLSVERWAFTTTPGLTF